MATVNGTNENDVLGGTQEDGDRIRGRDGDDTMYGVGGNDTINGGDGDDLLVGAAGADELTGGDGADTFAIYAASDLTNNGWTYSRNAEGERDTITDFNSAEGDKIDFTGLYRNIDTDGNGISEQYAVTWDDVTVISLGGDEYRVVVTQVDGDPQWDLGIDVIGAAPTEADFIF